MYCATCYMLFIVYIYIYICVAYVSVGPDQRGLLCAESGFGMRGSQGHMSHAVPPLSTETYTAHTATAKLQTAVGPAMQKGVQHAPI